MVMDTAAPPVETAAVDEAPPPSAPETAPSDAPETTPVPVAPETVTPGPETPDLAALLKGLKDEDLEQLEPVKWLIDRKSESARRKAENDSAKTVAAQRQEWLAKGDYARDLEGILRSSAKTNDLGELDLQLNLDGVESFVDKVWGASTLGTMNAALSVIESQLPEGVTIDPADLRNLQNLYAESVKSPAKSQELLLAEMGVLKKAWLEEAKPALRKEIEADLKKQAELAAKSASIREADEAQRESPTPTRVAGNTGAPTSYETMAAADAAFHDGDINLDRYKAERKRFGVKD